MGFLNKRHCEKTSFVVAGGVVAMGILVASMFKGFAIPTVNVNGIELSYLVIAGLITLAGYLGVIYYRISKHKKPILKLDFWNA